MIAYRSIGVACALFGAIASVKAEPISSDRYLKACLFSAAELLPKTPGLIIEKSSGKVDRQADGAIVTATFDVAALGMKATYRFMCGYKGTQVIPIQRIFVE